LWSLGFVSQVKLHKKRNIFEKQVYLPDEFEYPDACSSFSPAALRLDYGQKGSKKGHISFAIHTG